MSKKPLVSILIVNWNGSKTFEKCLKALKRVRYENWELILVDNASTDGSYNLPKQHKIQNLKVIRNKKNVGFAKANNQGYKLTKGKYVLLLNNDTEVSPNFLGKLVDRIEKDTSIGIIQPKILLVNDPKRLDSVGSFLTRTGFLQHLGFLEKDGKKYSKEMFIFSAKGACMLIRRSVIDRVGLFDESYISYLEETDFCWRVWLSGKKILYYPKAKIKHKVGHTSKKLNQTDVNYHSFKNRIATLYKNLSTINLIAIYIPHIVLITGLSVYFLIKARFKSAAIILRAIYWNAINFKNLSRKRRKSQSLRVVSDNELFKIVVKPFDFKSMLGHFIRSEKALQGEHQV